MNRIDTVLFRASNAEQVENSLNELFSIPLQEQELQNWRIPQFSHKKENLQRKGEKMIAEWLFFLHCIAIQLPKDWEFYQEFYVWENLPLKELLKYSGAVACLPVAGKNHDPQLVRLYVITGTRIADMRFLFPGSLNISERYKLFFSASGALSSFDGCSWQLAAALAIRAIESKQGTFKQELAWNWIVTGEIQQGNVCRIELGNKLQLSEKLKKNRKWLLPKDNFSEEFSDKEIYGIPSIDRAWRLIQGKEIVSAEIQLRLPVSIEHILVGDSNSPILSSIFQLEPGKVILWHTNRTVYCARQVEKLLHITEEKNQEFHAPQIELKEIPADDLSGLLEIFEENFRNIPNTIINFTGGNRLIGFAAILAAQKKSTIQLVYREKYQEKFQLHLLDFSQSQARNGITYIEPSNFFLLNNINWDNLFNTPSVDENTLFHKKSENII